jgi:hypothetical protein
MQYSIELPDYWRKIDLKEQPAFHPVGASATAVNQERNLGYIFGGVDGSNRLNSRLYTFDMDSETIELYDELPLAGLKPDGMKGYHTWSEIMVLDFNMIDEEAWMGHP